MIYIFLLIFFSINVLPNHAQKPSFVKNQIIIQDAVGDIQTRYLNSHIWTPVTAGITIPPNSFIRLNSPNSTINIAYPDGSMVRLIGIGSFFFEDISELINNAYQSKILVLFGRWTYQSHPDYHSRFIVNTDITTSVVENGIGAGFFYNGTNEFVLKKGRGLISYRQQNAKAIVLDEQQYVKFNVLDGFFFPKLATEELFKQYLLFSKENATIDKNTKDLDTLSLLSYMKSPNAALKNDIPQKTLMREEITIQQLKALKDLDFKKRSDLLAVTIPKIPKIVEPVPIAISIYTPVIPKDLLTEINVKNFEITTKKPIAEITDITIPDEVLISRNVVPRKLVPKPKKIAILKTIEEKKSREATEARKAREAMAASDTIKNMKDSEATEVMKALEALEEMKVKEAIEAKEEREVQEAQEAIEAQKAREAQEAQEAIEALEEALEAQIREERANETPEERGEREAIEAWRAVKAQETKEEEMKNIYKADEKYLNRNLESEIYRVNQFDVQGIDDILNSEFSSVLY